MGIMAAVDLRVTFTKYIYSVCQPGLCFIFTQLLIVKFVKLSNLILHICGQIKYPTLELYLQTLVEEHSIKLNQSFGWLR